MTELDNSTNLSMLISENTTPEQFDQVVKMLIGGTQVDFEIFRDALLNLFSFAPGDQTCFDENTMKYVLLEPGKTVSDFSMITKLMLKIGAIKKSTKTEGFYFIEPDLSAKLSVIFDRYEDIEDLD